jgi:hypothetical protein
VVALALSISAIAQAQSNNTPITPADAAGKTGLFPLKLSERSPLSAADEIAKRFKTKPTELGADYELSKQVFAVYVASQPAANGKYGLIAGIVMSGGAPPTAWHAVLDKYHLIWIAPSDGNDDQPLLQRIGETLDATAAARKTWPIDDQRVYVSITTDRRIITGFGLNYPDIYTGVMNTFHIAWYTKLQDSGHPPRTWSVDNCPRPLDQYLALDKTRVRYFFPSLDDATGVRNMTEELIFRRGYQQAGFRHVKMIKVPQDQMDAWPTYSADWFEQGIQFLDSAATELAATTEPLTQASPTTAPALAQNNFPKLDDPAAKAAASLSLAKNYVAAEKYDMARPRLQKIIDTYPDTPAASESATILQQIDGK